MPDGNYMHNGLFESSQEDQLAQWGGNIGDELEFGFDCSKCTAVLKEDGTKATLLFQEGTKIKVVDILEGEVHIVLGNTLYRVQQCISFSPDREIRSLKTGEVVYVQKGGRHQNFLRGWFK